MLSRMLSSSSSRNLPADGLLHQIAEPRGLLDARAGLGAQVQLELAGVGAGKEVLPEPRAPAETPSRQTSRNSGTKTDAPMRPAWPAEPSSRRAAARIRARKPAAAAPRDCATARRAAAASADTSPASEPGFAKEHKTPASRTPPLPPAARTGIAPRRSGRTSAGTRCRCTAWRPAPGTAICAAPSRIAVCRSPCPCSR